MTYLNKQRSGRSLVILALGLALFLSLAAYYAPKYLAYADAPVRSDAIVLFIGPGFSAREMEAWKLIEEGYAEYLLIPAVGSVGKNSSAILGMVNFRREMGKFFKPNLDGIPEDRQIPFPNGNLPILNTHIEILEAKRMMSEHGLRSALFVSSPWHMRRIKIITRRVFDEEGEYAIAFVPTSFEKQPDGFSGLLEYSYRSIIQEYLKISAFWVYSHMEGRPI